MCAFRLTWRGETAALEAVWSNIVEYRQKVDKVLNSVSQVDLVVSAISGTVVHYQSRALETFPALAYWVVGRKSSFGDMELATRVQQCSAQLGAVVKPLTVRRAASAEEGAQAALFMVVKDHGEGYVRARVNVCPVLSQSADGSGIGRQEPIVKFLVRDPKYLGLLQAAESDFHHAHFVAVVELVK